MVGGKGWVELSDEDTMEGGGRGVARVMKVAHARSPLCCIPVEETSQRDGKMGREESSTTCCCWTWHTEPASAGGAL